MSDLPVPAASAAITDSWMPLVIAPKSIPGSPTSLLDAVAMVGGNDIEFDPPRLQGPLFRAADLG